MSANSVRRVFDDENDRWIAVLPDETDRDALLRARAEGAPSVPPPMGASRTGMPRPRPSINRPFETLKAIAIGGLGLGALLYLVGVASGFNAYSLEEAASFALLTGIGGTLFIFGALAGLLALTAAAINAPRLPRQSD